MQSTFLYINVNIGTDLIMINELTTFVNKGRHYCSCFISSIVSVLETTHKCDSANCCVTFTSTYIYLNQDEG